MYEADAEEKVHDCKGNVIEPVIFLKELYENRLAALEHILPDLNPKLYLVMKKTCVEFLLEKI